MSGRLAGAHCILLATALLSLLWFTSGCELMPAAEQEISFQFALPQGWQVVNASEVGEVPRLDTDGDGDQEWVLLYSFDASGDDAFAPIRCAIYQAVDREPRLPIIYPYHLQAPGWTYLGEGAERVSVRVDDVVQNIQPDDNYADGASFAQNEVIVENRAISEDKDTPGPVIRVSIFQWRNTVPEEFRERTDPREHIVIPGQPPGFNSQWYQCIGFFEGTVQVEVEKDQVTVTDRLNDRSQLARINVYRPSAGADGYLYNAQRLVEPASSCIGFAFALPEDVVQSPYPEKIVVAFHQAFRNAVGDYGAAYLTENAQTARGKKPAWDLFAKLRQPAVEDVCIKTLRYGSELEAEIRSFNTSLSAQVTGGQPPPITTQVETVAQYQIPGQGVQQRRVVWQLVQEGNEWKIEDILEIQ
ncbi:MAG: hypothetical protein JXA09_11450 [Anaerolineae bacterium]|nr:hypothetical protein [Anaerolineae bacterium]